MALLAVVLVVVASGGGSPSSPPASGSTPTTVAGETGTTVPPTTLPDSEFVDYFDDDAGFSVRIPKVWKQFKATDANVHLVAALPPPVDGPADVGLTVRLTRTEVPTTSENIANLQTVTDGIVTSNPTVQILLREQINGEIDGMPGFYYLYTFTDEATGRVGAHGHYFLFRGTKMNQLVFQAVPTEEYGRLGAMFDQVVESFKSLPDPVSESPTTTTAG